MFLLVYINTKQNNEHYIHGRITMNIPEAETVNPVQSKKKSINAGVPQEGVLSPTLLN